MSNPKDSEKQAVILISPNKIHAKFSEKGGIKPLRELRKTKNTDKLISLETVLDSNGIEDAIWCMRALDEGYSTAARLLICEYAASTLHLFESYCPDDDCPRKTLETAIKFVQDLASQEELAVACTAIENVAWNEKWSRSTSPLNFAAWDAATSVALATACAAGQSVLQVADRALLGYAEGNSISWDAGLVSAEHAASAAAWAATGRDANYNERAEVMSKEWRLGREEESIKQANKFRCFCRGEYKIENNSVKSGPTP